MHSEMLYILLSVAAAANVDVALPASASGTLHVLLLGSKPVARSYDGHAWERTQGGATMDLRCEQGASCVATIAEGTPYKIESHDGPSRSAAEQASRFLVQATFGPTRASMEEVDATTTEGVQSWISAQMELPPSLHRVYYRERANPRAFTKTPTGGLRSVCEAGSRWHSFAFTRSDEGKQMAVSSATHGGFALRVGGLLRTEVPASTNLAVGATYLLCKVQERVGGPLLLAAESESGEDCLSASVEAVDNPPISFKVPDLFVTHTLSDDDRGRLTALAPEVRNVSLLDGPLRCAPALQSATHVFLRAGAAYYRHDPRLQLLNNPLGAPADGSEAAGAALPRVAKTFLNRESCSVLKAGGSQSWTSALFTLNSTMLRNFYTIDGKYIYLVDDLRLEGEDYSRSPCSGISRWRRRAGACSPATALEPATKTAIEVAIRAGDDGFSEAIDVEIQGDCSADAATIGARLTLDGECWEHSHPDQLNVYDFSNWVVGHPGGPGKITQFAEAGGNALAFPGSHEMTRWKDHQSALTFLGRLGESVDFRRLPPALQSQAYAE